MSVAIEYLVSFSEAYDYKTKSYGRQYYTLCE